MLLRTALRPSLSFSPIAKTASIPRTTRGGLLNRPVLVAFGLSISLPFFQARPVTRLDTSPYSPQASQSAPFSSTISREAKTPLTKDGKTLNPAAVKQISLGAILGLGAGVVLSAFSRSLTLLIGLGIVLWQVSQPMFESGNIDN
jgi:hypothetical protein